MVNEIYGDRRNKYYGLDYASQQQLKTGRLSRLREKVIDQRISKIKQDLTFAPEVKNRKAYEKWSL